MMIDSHAHLTIPPLDVEVDALLQRAEAAHVKPIINVCIDKLSLEKGLQVAKEYPWVYTAASVHPHDASNVDLSFVALIEKTLKEKKLIAIGETGLEYHYDFAKKSDQKEWLTKQLRLAAEYHLPLIIHCRDAFQDLFALVEKELRCPPLLIHCFTGGPEEAKEAIARGFFISLSGIVTFKKSESLRLALQEIPLEKMLIETDSPFLAPEGHRGKPNEPSLLPEIAAFVAALKGVTPEQLAKITFQNSLNFFKIGNFSSS